METERLKCQSAIYWCFLLIAGAVVGCRPDDVSPADKAPQRQPPNSTQNMVPSGSAADMKELIRQACERAEGAVVTLVARMRTYGRDNLHRYMDGAAERYLGYSFDRLVVASARVQDEPFTIELYHFRVSADAYGIWSTDCAGEFVGIGQNSAYGHGLLQFWRGCYYARIYHKKYRDGARQAILAVGRALSNAIRQSAAPPAILAELPQEGLRGMPVFFHEQAMLNHLYYVSDENLLRLGPRTDAVFAEYEKDDQQAKLLVVQYASKRAHEARMAFATEYLEVTPGEGSLLAKLENNLWTGISEIRENTLRIVFDASTKELGSRLLSPPGQNKPSP